MEAKKGGNPMSTAKRPAVDYGTEQLIRQALSDGTAVEALVDTLSKALAIVRAAEQALPLVRERTALERDVARLRDEVRDLRQEKRSLDRELEEKGAMWDELDRRIVEAQEAVNQLPKVTQEAAFLRKLAEGLEKEIAAREATLQDLERQIAEREARLGA